MEIGILIINNIENLNLLTIVSYRECRIYYKNGELKIIGMLMTTHVLVVTPTVSATSTIYNNAVTGAIA